MICNEMKKITIWLFVYLCFLSASAQKSTIKWSEEFAEEKGEHLGKVIYYDGKYLYVNVFVIDKHNFKNIKETPGIIKFDSEMKPVKRQDYKADIASKEDVFFNGIHYLGGDFVMITNIYDKKTNTRELFAQKINKDNLKTEGKLVSIMKVTGEKRTDFDYDLSFSEDSSKLVINVNPIQKKKQYERFAFKIIDKDFKTVSEKSVELPYYDEDFRVSSIKVNSKNQLFLLAKAYKSGSKKETMKDENSNKVASYEVVLKKFSTDGVVQDFNLDLSGKFLNDFEMTLDKKGDLFLCGLYKAEDNEFVNGYFYFHLDGETGKVLHTNSFNFPLSFITHVNELEDDKTKGKNPGVSSRFSVSDLIVTDDGRIYTIFEKNWSVRTQNKYGNYFTYYSRGMIMMQMDMSGKQKWYHYVAKDQYYNSITWYLSHTNMVLNDRLLVFYNDKTDNVHYNISSKKMPKKFNEIKEMSFMGIDIDTNGKLERKEFSNSAKMGTSPLISFCLQTGINKFLLYGFLPKKKLISYDPSNGTNKLGMITFEQ